MAPIPDTPAVVLAEIIGGGHLRILARGYAQLGHARAATELDTLIERGHQALRALDIHTAPVARFPDTQADGPVRQGGGRLDTPEARAAMAGAA